LADDVDAEAGEEDGMKTVMVAVALVAVLSCSSGPPIAPAMTYDQRNENVARELLTNFNAGRFDAAVKNFDPTMMKQLPPSKLRQVSDQIKTQAGPLKSVGTAQFTTEQGYRVVTLPAQYEKGNVNVRVVFDGAGRVAGLFFTPAS
jgi:hypothetical protein